MSVRSASAAIVAASALTAGVSAGVVHHTDLTNNRAAAYLSSSEGDVNVVAIGGNFKHKTVAGHHATGITGGSVNGEIDGTEAIAFTFSEPVFVSSLAISFLYTAGNHGDVWSEAALMSTDAGDFVLTASDSTIGTWTGFGTLSNLSPGVQGHGGKWMLSGDDIFGGPITSLIMSSADPGAAKYSDFAFYSMSYYVPAPGAMALLLVAAGVGVSRRRK